MSMKSNRQSLRFWLERAGLLAGAILLMLSGMAIWSKWGPWGLLVGFLAVIGAHVAFVLVAALAYGIFAKARGLDGN